MYIYYSGFASILRLILVSEFWVFAVFRCVRKLGDFFLYSRGVDFGSCTSLWLCLFQLMGFCKNYVAFKLGSVKKFLDLFWSFWGILR